MVSKSQMSLIRKLQQKKYRAQLQLFIVEGKKSILEFLSEDYQLHTLFCTDLFSKSLSEKEVVFIDNNSLKKISTLKNPDEGLAIFHIKENLPIDSDITLVLDKVRDAGNLGTIIRLCDWFGITQIICSEDTVDCYNPKVVQATMGSLSRVQIEYKSLEKYLENIKFPILGATMDGENIYQTELPKKVVLIMGNEANGISKTIMNFLTQKITIPKFGHSQKTESLNVAVATSILLSELKRRS